MPRATDKYANERLIRLVNRPDEAVFTKVNRHKKDGTILEPNYDFLGSRTRRENGSFLPQWRPDGTRVISEDEFDGETHILKDSARLISPELNKVKSQMSEDYVSSYYGWTGTIVPEYDMREPMAIYDTEPYFKRAVTRRLDLAFRNGFKILSAREKDARYTRKRIAAYEFVFGRKFDNLLKGILFNLFTTANCFVVKLRKAGPEGAGVPKKEGRKTPIAGFSIIPSHQIFPYLINGKIDHWRHFFETGRPFQRIENDDLYHFELDRKPGHIYATPRTVGVREDIFALRRLEENIELLFVNHLFPLFHVKVGTPEAECTYGPNGESEVDLIKFQIENMPKEGVFTTDERVEVKVIGAEGNSLDFKELISHYKSRIFTGLGVSAIDMGEGADATRATADNVSQNLKDSIKADLDMFAGQLQLTIFKDWFLEANYSTSVPEAVASTYIKFAEIDLDNLIKWQNHILQLFNGHLLTEPEARGEISQKPIKGSEKKDPNDRSLLHYNLHVVDLVWQTEKAKQQENLKAQQELVPMETREQTKLLGAQTKLAMVQAKAEQIKAGAKEKVLQAQSKHMPLIAKAKVTASKAISKSKGRPQAATSKKSTQTAKSVQNKVTPTNQHGSNLSPTKAKSSLIRTTFIEDCYERLIDAQTNLEATGSNWRDVSTAAIDAAFANTQQQEKELTGGNYYTNQVGEQITRLKLLVAEESHPEMLAVLVSTGLDEELPDVESEYTV